jgi:exodeoxyribonuclease VIII
MEFFELIKASQKSGKPSGIFWFSAKTEARGKLQAQVILEDAGIETGRGKDYQNPVRTDFPVYNDLPEEGLIDFTWCDRYELQEDGRTWKLKPDTESVSAVEGAAPDETVAPLAPKANVEVSHAADNGDLRPISRLRLIQRLIAHLMHDEELNQITMEQHIEIGAMEGNGESCFVQGLLLAIADTPAIKELSAHVEWKLVKAVKKIFQLDQEHDAELIARFVNAWVQAESGERCQLVEDWVNENPPTQDADVTDEGTDKANENIGSSVQDRAFTHQQYSFEQRVFGTWLYGLFDELSDDQKLEISRLSMDMDATYPQNVLLACRNNDIRQLQHVFPETLADLFTDTKSIWPADGKSPQLGQLVSFFSDWINGHNSDTASTDGRKPGRDAVTAKWLKKSGKQITQHTDTGTNAGGDVKTDRPEGAPHNLDTLDIELACALYPSDFDVFEVPGPIFRRAKEMVRQKEEPWKSWSAVLRKSAGILDVNRTAIFNLVRLAPEDIHLDPVKHLEFVNHTLTTEFAKATELLPLNTGNSASTPEDISKSLAAERGEFVPGFSNPADPEWVHEDLSQPKVENLGSGIFSLEGLTGNAPSNEVAIQEVENADHVQMEETGNSQNETEAPVPAVESVDAADTPAVTLTGADILAANAPHLADQAETDTNQNTDIPHQTGPETEQKQPEAQQIEPPVQQPEPPVPEFPAYFEPGRYEGLPNEVYHAANGVSSTQVKDARISLMYFNGRHVARTIPREETRALQFGTVLHALTLEPEKFGDEFTVFPGLPEGAIATTAEMKKIIEEFNAALPPLMDADSLKKMIEAHNSALPAPLSLNGNAEETALLYQGLADEFRRIPETEKHTAAAMKACIKEFNATLPQPLKVSGGRDALLAQLADIEPEFVSAERAKKQPYNISGNKDALAAIVREINPEAVLAEEFIAQWQAGATGKSIVSDVDFSHLEALNRAAYAHPSAGKLLRHPSREVEVSYFGIDEQTGLEVRVRPDIELEIDGMRIAADLKTLGIANVKQERLRDRLHREITERDYHLSAAMYSEVADFDQFFWIFINKEPGYHWVAVIEASPELLELGSLEYHNTMQAIATAFDTGEWPAPVTSDYTDELNDFDLRRLEALRARA